jgi:threonine aldolase
LSEIRRIRKVCEEQGLAMHLDGARLFNALAVTGDTPQSFGQLFDTISVCLSKGLGAPAGSLLLGSRERMAKAHRLRKVMGGGMRQAGFIAAAGLYALDHHVGRLEEDHRKARTLARELHGLPYVQEVLPVETNIVIFRLVESAGTERFLTYLAEHDIRALSIGRRLIRFVFHLDVSDAGFEALLEAMRRFR